MAATIAITAVWTVLGNCGVPLEKFTLCAWPLKTRKGYMRNQILDIYWTNDSDYGVWKIWNEVLNENLE